MYYCKWFLSAKDILKRYDSYALHYYNCTWLCVLEVGRQRVHRTVIGSRKGVTLTTSWAHQWEGGALSPGPDVTASWEGQRCQTSWIQQESPQFTHLLRCSCLLNVSWILELGDFPGFAWQHLSVNCAKRTREAFGFLSFLYIWVSQEISLHVLLQRCFSNYFMSRTPKLTLNSSQTPIWKAMTVAPIREDF